MKSYAKIYNMLSSANVIIIIAGLYIRIIYMPLWWGLYTLYIQIIHPEINVYTSEQLLNGALLETQHDLSLDDVIYAWFALLYDVHLLIFNFPRYIYPYHIQNKKSLRKLFRHLRMTKPDSASITWYITENTPLLESFIKTYIIYTHAKVYDIYFPRTFLATSDQTRLFSTLIYTDLFASVSRIRAHSSSRPVSTNHSFKATLYFQDKISCAQITCCVSTALL